MTDKQVIIDGEHDMNYYKDNNCKYYGNKEQCKKTHCYYRCYSKLYTAHKAKEQKNEELKQTLAEIKFLVRELLKRTGQVVPYEIKQILQKINEYEVKND